MNGLLPKSRLLVFPNGKSSQDGSVVLLTGYALGCGGLKRRMPFKITGRHNTSWRSVIDSAMNVPLEFYFTT